MMCCECPDFIADPQQEGFGVCPHRGETIRKWVRANQSACARLSDGKGIPVPKNTLSPELWHLVGAEDVKQKRCVVCGKTATNKHHVIERSEGSLLGGRKIHKPVVTLCGSGTTGCHGKVHEGRLHLDWRNGEWEFLETEEVTSQKHAYKLDGWKPCKYVGETK